MPTARRTIVVTCVGGALIYDVINALRNAPDFAARIIGCDADPHAIGRVLTDRFVVMPYAERDPSAYIDAIWQVIGEENPDLVLPLSEGESRVLAEIRDDLVGVGVSVSVSSLESVVVMTDKLMLMQRLRAKRIHCLDCLPVSNLDELDLALKELGYPRRAVVVKPRRASGARGIWIFDSKIKKFQPGPGQRQSGWGDRDAIVKEFELTNSDLENRVATPFVEGPIYDVDCIAINGEALDIVPRLRQWRDPLTAASTGNRVEMNTEVIRYCRDLCRALNVDGAADYDVVLDSDGRAVVLDAGTRLSGSVGGAVAAGANIPAQLVRVLTGLKRIKFDINNGCVIRPFLTFAEIPSKNQHDLL